MSGQINQEKEKAGQDTEARVRVVEHIKKNLTLFESNREIYELHPNYESRGHLQTLLDKKQSNQRPHSSVHHHKLYNDQYTQYRPSDFVTDQRLICQSNPLKDNTLKDTQREVKLKNLKSQPSSHGTLPKVIRRQTDPLRRSVSSLSELIRKQLDFVKRRNRSRDREKQPQTNIGLEESREEQYKVPVEQQYSTSQSLYLLPTPDYRVHIDTRFIKDIILAYQRAERYSGNRLRAKDTILKFVSARKSNSPGNTNLVRNSKKRLRNTGATSSDQLRSSRDQRRDQPPNLDLSANRIKAKVKMPSGKSDKATIIDNKDGTIKISYEPKEVGQHEISLRYNDEPIDESPVVFYVDAVGAAKKKITAYGPGLTHGLAGESSQFTINTGGLGSSKLNVVVEGPSKTPVNLNDNKDGTITVSYTPGLPGEYKIKMSFDGKQVVGSPFITVISDEGRQRSHINVGRGSEHTLDLKISEEDLKSLNAIIVTPCGLEEPCQLKLMKTGQLAIVFTPREQGEHIVNIKRLGNHIGGSPFKFDVLSRDIGDAKQVKISGKNLKEGKTNSDNEIVINTKDAGFGGLSVALEGPGRSEITSGDVSDGTIKLNYRPFEPGTYSLIVKYADHIVPGSPFAVKVTGQGTNPQKETIRKFRKAVASADPNTDCHFTFKMPGTSAYDLSARVHSPQGQKDDASIKDMGDYVYQVSFTPKEVGLYSLSIRNKEIHIGGSPFPFTVGPILESGAHRVRCGGPGLIRGPCGKLNEFNVFTREAGAGELSVTVEGPSKPELTYTDRRDGSCHIGYKVAAAGEYRVSVLFNDLEVPESPFRVFIMPQSGDVAKIELGPMPPENMIQLNKPCNLTVIMNGAKGNIEGKVKLPSGKMEDCFASPIDAENWGVRFIPRELGIHQVHIKFNKGSMHIPQSPILIRVGHDKADPASVVAHGNGLKGANVNHATDFVVETCNAGHGLLEVNIEGPSKVSMGCAEIDEGYRVSYTPLSPGDYFISVKYHGCHISGSPFRVRATKQPGSRTVADTGSHEISTISIATTDREAKQKVENMPKFKSDASRVYCKGMGLKKAFAGKPNTLTVNCSEAGFNLISAAFCGPTRNTIHECSIKHMGGNIYEVKYTCKDKGDAILVVKYGDEMIPGSPFRLDVV